MIRAKGFLFIALCLIGLTILVTDIRTNIGDFFFSAQDKDAGFLIGQFQSEELSRRYLVGLAHEKVDKKDVVNFIRTFKNQLNTLPAVTRAWSAQDGRSDFAELIRFYQPHAVHLYSLTPKSDFKGLFSQAGMDARAEMIKEGLFGPDPERIKSLIENDPMLLSLSWLEKLQSFSRKTSVQENYSTFLIETRPSGLDIDVQIEILADINRLFDQLNQQYNAAFSLQISGIPVFAIAIKEQIGSDIQRVTTLSTIAMTLLFFFVFRSLKALLITATILIVTISVATLVTQGFFGFVHGLTLALGITLVGVCVDYIIHGMVHATGKTGEHRKNAFRAIWPSLLLGGITTTIGYAAISFSGFPGLQQIVVFAASGILTALVITRFVLPDLMDTFKLSILPRIQTRSFHRLIKKPVVRILILSLVGVCFLSGISQVQWSSSLNTLSPELEQLQQKDQQIRSRSVNIEPGRFIIIEGDNPEQALLNAEQTHQRLNTLISTEPTLEFYPVYPWIASETLQKKNQQHWNNSLSDALRKRWNSTLEAHGFAARAFPALKNNSEPLLTTEHLKSSPYWPAVSQQIIETDSKHAIIFWLGKHDPETLKQALSTLEHSRYFSQKDSIDQLALDYRQQSLTLLFWGLVAILLVLIIRYRSVLQPLKILTPALLSILAVLGAWGLLGNAMTILNLIGLLLVAAICVDYGIFYYENRSGDLSVTFKAITVSALTTFVSFACLSITETPAMMALAGTVAPGVIIGFILCPVILNKQLN